MRTVTCPWRYGTTVKQYSSGSEKRGGTYGHELCQWANFSSSVYLVFIQHCSVDLYYILFPGVVNEGTKVPWIDKGFWQRARQNVASIIERGRGKMMS